jgi:hypothetical protein
MLHFALSLSIIQQTFPDIFLKHYLYLIPPD